MLKTLYIKTYGCKMNDYDSSMIINILSYKKNIKLITSPKAADILVLNTCSIREKASEKIFSQLGCWYKLKKNNPNLILCVGGCVASQEGEFLFKRAPYVDIIFGPQTLHLLPKMIDDVYKTKKRTIDISFPGLDKFKTLKIHNNNTIIGPTALISIIEGCSKYCSYCIVPYTRGEELSRSVNDIIIEITNLANNGISEIILLGQNVNAYKGMYKNQLINFSKLIRLIAEINNIKRIRYTTSHPLDFSDELMITHLEVEKLMNYVHLPIQSGSDRILKLMNRNYSVQEYKLIIDKLKTLVPNICISSDFIIGFPGETDKDFQDTIQCIKNIGFDFSYSFLYSNRPGTLATDLEDKISYDIKKNRLFKIQNILYQQGCNISKQLVGSKQKILVSNVYKYNSSILQGRTENNRIVNFYCNDKNLIGNVINVKIISISNPYILYGIL